MISKDSRTLADLLAELWSDERCDWRVEHHGVPWNKTDDPFIVVLEWTQEYGNDHGADWTTFTWQFHGSSVEDALEIAVEWCEELAPWASCDECDHPVHALGWCPGGDRFTCACGTGLNGSSAS